ncbi:MAG: DNA polymerase III subunit gamma/tau [Oscillospiraceae bacterium]|nr:DNA polymerase III subunit gamma/tau [Oscillospiraceae bacterium]
MYQALYRKWRPKTFDDVVGQPHITETLKGQLMADRVSHAYLFVGTRGTGKTSCAKILAKAVNCEDLQDGNPCNACPACAGIDSGSILDVEELDAASNNGVDHVRALRDEAIFTPAAVKKRVYIVDEVHMLSTAAFNALLKILEEPPPHLLFILATTEAHKVPATILSRCQRHAFKRVSAADIKGRLLAVSAQEGIVLQEDAAELLSRLADGSVRDAWALLDQCATGETVDENLVLDLVGLAGSDNIAELLRATVGRDVELALTLVNTLYNAGRDMGSLLNELATLIRDILLIRMAPVGSANLLSGGFDRKIMDSFAPLTTEWLMFALNQITAALADLPRSANRKLAAELCVIRLCNVGISGDIDALQARVAQLEQGSPAGERPIPSPVPGIQPIQENTPVLAEPPPWEEELTPHQAEPVSIPVMESNPEPEPAPESLPEPPQATPAADTDIWKTILTRAQPELDVSIYTLMSDGNEVCAALDKQTLDLYIENEFTKAMAETKDVQDAIRRAADAVTGAPIQLKTHLGRPVSGAWNSKLDALAKKGLPIVKIK